MFDLQTSHNIAIFVVNFIGKEFTRRNTKMFKNTKIVNFTISILKNPEGHVLPPSAPHVLPLQLWHCEIYYSDLLIENHTIYNFRSLI